MSGQGRIRSLILVAIMMKKVMLEELNPATSSCCSEDDSNASQEPIGGASSSLSSKGNGVLNLNGKTRASQGAATDPQSIYARVSCLSIL